MQSPAPSLTPLSAHERGLVIAKSVAYQFSVTAAAPGTPGPPGFSGKDMPEPTMKMGMRLDALTRPTKVLSRGRSVEKSLPLPKVHSHRPNPRSSRAASVNAAAGLTTVC